ncbi:MAG TPA: response regulator, partial [Candidatus Polarisedimenticolia bacterium]|nr:response regulator [Candidatus Polarisedimenticolia bacterium]
MSVRAVIVDDEKPARDRLRRLLGEHPDINLVGEAADAAAAAALIDRERPDLCFLDVQMPEGDGFEVLRRIKHRPRVIFTTAYDRYAVPAFEVSSLDYLLKPFSRERFAAAIEKARAAIGAGAAPPPGEILRLLEE